PRHTHTQGLQFLLYSMPEYLSPHTHTHTHIFFSLSLPLSPPLHSSHVTLILCSLIEPRQMTRTLNFSKSSWSPACYFILLNKTSHSCHCHSLKGSSPLSVLVLP